MPICQICFTLKDRLQNGPLEGAGECSSPHCYFFPCCEFCPECKDYLDRIRGEGRYTVVIPEKKIDGKRIHVHLTETEMKETIDTALACYAWARDNNIREQETSNPEKGIQNEITGALCERAACKGLGYPWNRRIGKFKDSDAGPYETRATTWSNGKLRLNRHGTKRGKVYILVIDRRPDFILAGWMLAENAMQPKYWGFHYASSKKPCWGVPQEDLMTMDTLGK